MPEARAHQTSGWRWNIGAALLAFAVYFCMYAFRKPFAAGVYAGPESLGLSLKTGFVVSQVLGYAASKYLGMRWVSEAPRSRRFPLLIGLILGAELALLGFALLPHPFKGVALFFNGLPLGMVWGLVVRYLEGRRASDFLLASLSCSFIVASGVVKDVGRWLLTEFQVPEYWMPALTGFFFLAPFVVCAWLLEKFPEPNHDDQLLCAARPPMDASARRRFFRELWPGLLTLLFVYLMLTAFRDYRDNYGVELFRELGTQANATLFTQTELWVGLLVLCAMGTLGIVRSRRAGLVLLFGMMILGLACIGAGTAARQQQLISGQAWMILTGVGAYLAYVPFSSFLFDRLVATSGFAGTAVFAINLMDAVGYSGSVVLLLAKDLGANSASRLAFFDRVSYALGGLGSGLLVFAAWYFLARNPTRQAEGYAAVR